jgi:hypothetical protein
MDHTNIKILFYLCITKLINKIQKTVHKKLTWKFKTSLRIIILKIDIVFKTILRRKNKQNSTIISMKSEQYLKYIKVKALTIKATITIQISKNSWIKTLKNKTKLVTQSINNSKIKMRYSRTRTLKNKWLKINFRKTVQYKTKA